MGGRGPRRLSDIMAIAKAAGCTIENTGGKHNWSVTKAGRRPYTIPAHNGERSEVPWKYIQGLCRAMLISEELFTSDVKPVRESKPDLEAERAAAKAAKQAAAYQEKMEAERLAAEAIAAQAKAAEEAERAKNLQTDGVPAVARTPTPKSGPNRISPEDN